MDITEEIKSRLSIEQLVAQYVSLKPSGKNLKGLCPFHQEKSASFMVSPEKQIAWCFGCQKGGDIFAFIEEIENCDFKESIKLLAEKTNVDMSKSEYKMDFVPKEKAEKKDIFYEIHEEAGKFFVDHLWDTDDGKKVLDYLHGRGIGDEFIKIFSLGFAPDSYDATYNYLLSKNFQKKDLIESGMLSSKDIESANVYDKFRCRLMFPIRNPSSKIVAFGGRSLKKEQDPKYLNSPETIIYSKGKLLYGFDAAKTEIKAKNEVIFVEGYMDLIASAQAGVTNVVAVSGTGLTIEQLKFMKRFTNNIKFSFDTDIAGQSATLRAIELAKSLDFNIYIIEVPEGKDPGDYASKQPEKWVELAATKTYFLDFYFEKIKKNLNVDSFDDNKQAQNLLIPLLSIIKDDFELEKAIVNASLKLKLSKKYITDKVNSIKNQTYKTHKKSDYALETNLQAKVHSEALAILFSFEDLLFKHLNDFVEILQELPDLPLNEPLKGIYNKILLYYNADSSFTQISNFSFLNREDLQSLKIVQLKANLGEVCEAEKEQIFKKALNKLKSRIVQKKKLDYKLKKDFTLIDVLENYNKNFI